MKKNILIFVLILVLVNTVGFIYAANSAPATESTNENIVGRIGVKGPLEFNNTIFKLAWTAKPNDTYFAQEYLPDGEKVETYNQMLAIHLFIQDTKPYDAAIAKAMDLAKRRKTDPFCNYTLVSNPDETVFILDFTIYDAQDNLVEFDIYRYQQVELENGKKALMVFMFCKRGYGSDIKPFLLSLKGISKDLRDQIYSMETPQ